jgi:uncharacterized protein
MTSSPFHDGERAAQRWAGVPASKGSFIRPFMPEQHRELFEKLPFILVGSVDETSQPSASLLAGPPGFVRTQPDTLEVATALSEYDALATNLRRGARLGILGIEPHTRRRNRVNGLVVGIKPNAFTLLVEQSFGNCPKYITPRKLSYAPAKANAITPLATLAERERQLITSADTFFIATAHPKALLSNEPSHGVDVSHRGGPPGFVEFTGDCTLTISDYPGNNLFNTFGNILENPKVGLLFWDLPNQSLLTLTALAEPTKSSSNEGSGRRLTFHVNGARYLEGGCALHVESESC